MTSLDLGRIKATAKVDPPISVLFNAPHDSKTQVARAVMTKEPPSTHTRTLAWSRTHSLAHNYATEFLPGPKFREPHPPPLVTSEFSASAQVANHHT